MAAIDGCTVTVEGPGHSVFEGNTATDTRGAGALFIEGLGRITIQAGICAQNNSGPGGSFASLSKVNPGGTLVFDAEPGSTHIDGGAGAAIGLYGSNNDSLVQCGIGAPSWVNYPASISYNITGDPCECNAFVAGQSTTCDSCGAAGWDPLTCGCVVSGAGGGKCVGQ